MNFLRRLWHYIPRPFKFIQRKLDIQTEWVQFKDNLRPHRYKIAIVTLVCAFPLYRPYLSYQIKSTKHYFSTYIQQSLQPDAPAFQWTENFIKHLLDHIFNDPNMKQQALSFLFKLLKDQKFVSEILELLISALKSKPFMTELKNAISELLIHEINDPQVKQSINSLLIGFAVNQQIKTAFIQLISEVFSSEESVKTIVNLLKMGITNEQVKQALSESINFAVREVLADEQTLNQLKIFIFFLLRKFESDDQIKGMMDILFAKSLGLVKKKRDPDLDKLLLGKSNTDHVI